MTTENRTIPYDEAHQEGRDVTQSHSERPSPATLARNLADKRQAEKAGQGGESDGNGAQ